MPEVHLLEELLIVLALTVSIVYLFRKIRVPAIVRFLLAGTVARTKERSPGPFVNNSVEKLCMSFVADDSQ